MGALGAVALCVFSGCVSSGNGSAFAEYDDVTEVKVLELKRTSRAGEAVVEMVGTVHHGENCGDKTVVLDMYYVSQKGTPLAVQHPEIKK